MLFLDGATRHLGLIYDTIDLSSPRLLTHGIMSGVMSLRVGIISAAWGAQAHLPAWRAVPGVEVVAICTAHRETAEAAATQHSVAMPFWDAQEMARHPDIDIVDAGTRPSYRRAMCL